MENALKRLRHGPPSKNFALATLGPAAQDVFDPILDVLVESPTRQNVLHGDHPARKGEPVAPPARTRFRKVHAPVPLRGKPE